MMKFKVEIRDETDEIIIKLEHTVPSHLNSTLEVIKKCINKELDMIFTQWEVVNITIERLP